MTLFDLAASEPGYDSEVKWRRETMWSLSREVERLNRAGGVVDQHRALGIIAYAEEFQASLMSHVRDAAAPEGFRDDTTIHDFNFSHLKASIKSLIDMKSARLAQRIQKWIAAAAIFISCLALVSSLVSTHNAAIPRGPGGVLERDLVTLGALDWMLPIIAAEPLLTAVVVSVALLGLINYFIGDGPSYFNEVQRVLSQFARAIAVTTKRSTRAQRWIATGLNLIFALAALVPCYVLFRLVLGGGAW